MSTGTIPEGDQGQSGTAPWSSDLESRFSDPETRQAVDSYLRERWQPRMTQLEQTVAQSSDAQALYDAFREDPNGTFLSVTEQLYGAEEAERVVKALSGELGPAAQQQAEQAVENAVDQVSEVQPAGLPEEDRKILDEIKNDRMAQQYRQAVGELIDNAGFDQAMSAHALQNIHSFIAAADGDLDEGLKRYKIAMTGVTLAPAEAPVDPVTGQPAPPVIDGQGGPASSPPLQRKMSWDEAFKEFGDEVKQSNGRTPPPVGVA